MFDKENTLLTRGVTWLKCKGNERGGTIPILFPNLKMHSSYLKCTAYLVFIWP